MTQRGMTMVMVSLLSLAACTAVAADWPHWRGPNRDGIVAEANLRQTWPDQGPKELWRLKVGRGYASPVCVGGVLYLSTQQGQQETLWAIRADSGQVLWQQSQRGVTRRDYIGTRATPTVEGEFIYTFGNGGDVLCRRLADGRAVWSVNVLEQTGAKRLKYDLASTPRIEGDRLFVQTGEGGPVAVALDKRNGKLLWASQFRGTAGYAPPVLAELNGRQELLVFAGGALVSMDPANGRTLWQQPHPTKHEVNAATPVVHDGQVFIASAYGQGCQMLRPTAGTRPHVVWSDRDVQSRFASPILADGVLYVNSEGTLRCVNWTDGKSLWSAGDRDLALGVGGSFVRFDDKLVLLSETGRLSLVQATPAGVKKLSSAQLLNGKDNWAVPVICEGRLYVQGAEELICFDIAQK